jgi:hypothetical protein
VNAMLLTPLEMRSLNIPLPSTALSLEAASHAYADADSALLKRMPRSWRDFDHRAMAAMVLYTVLRSKKTADCTIGQPRRHQLYNRFDIFGRDLPRVKVAPNREPPRETSGPQDAQEGVTDAAVRHRFHLHETVAQKAVHEAARRADFR